MKTTIIGLLLAAGAVMAGLLSYQLWHSEPQLRHDFELTDMQGQTRSAAEFDGQLVLLNFWAPWCAPCRAEIPMLNELHARYANQGLQILGPAVDQITAIDAFLQKTAIDYPVLTGMPQVLRLQDAYGEQRLPFSVLIGREGQLVYQHAGELKKAEISQIIEENL